MRKFCLLMMALIVGVLFAGACARQDAKSVEQDLCSSEARKAVQVLCDFGVKEAGTEKVLDATVRICRDLIVVQERVCKHEAVPMVEGSSVVGGGAGDAGPGDGGGAPAPSGAQSAGAPGGTATPGEAVNVLQEKGK